ncbi:MAG: hypothetical protein HY046_06055 [Acidobacteria bacterium]|nr:hypothetical protein [Acidobacteriota bacterium]
MIFGFNTDIKVGKIVYHVQTEDRGQTNPVIDTTVYVGGRVVHKRATSYKKLFESPDFSKDILRQCLEEQHRGIIDELRSGTLKVDLPAPPPRAANAPAQPVSPGAQGGIHVQLLNPASWLAAGTATLKVEVKNSTSFEAIPNVRVMAKMEGISGQVNFSALTDHEGHAEIVFPLPRMGPGGSELIIHATGMAGDDEIKYSLKPKAKPATAGAGSAATSASAPSPR